MLPRVIYKLLNVKSRTVCWEYFPHIYAAFAHQFRWIDKNIYLESKYPIMTTKDINEVTLEMPQSRNTAFPWQNMKMRSGTINDQNKVAYLRKNEVLTKKKCNRGTVLEWSAEKLLGALNQYYSRKTSVQSPKQLWTDDKDITINIWCIYTSDAFYWYRRVHET